MKVLNVNSTLGLKSGGGTAERTFQMSRHLALEGMSVTVLTLDLDLDEARLQQIAPAQVVALKCISRRFFVPRWGWHEIKQRVNEADVIHLMGHWGVLNALVYLAARRLHKPYVVCPAGALPIFGRSAMLKRFYNWAVGHAIIKNASAWIAVTAAEFAQFEQYGIPPSRVTVIPNGVEEADFPDTERADFLRCHNLPNLPYILFMGRLSLIKGPDLLLQAFIRVHLHLPEYQLVFAGPDDGMKADLVSQAGRAGLAERVHFIGYVSGRDKAAAYRHAKLLAVPSRQEAMSIVALEAGICGTPVLLTDQCGFGGIKQISNDMEVAATVEGIAAGLTRLLNEQTLRRISPAWKDFVAQHFSWRRIVAEYGRLYQGLNGARI